MGMFDSFRMPKIELPDGTYSDEAFQTKDLACDLDEFYVTADGRVQVSVKNDDYEHVSWKSSQITATNVTLDNGELRLTADFYRGRLDRLDIL